MCWHHGVTFLSSSSSSSIWFRKLSNWSSLESWMQSDSFIHYIQQLVLWASVSLYACISILFLFPTLEMAWCHCPLNCHLSPLLCRKAKFFLTSTTTEPWDRAAISVGKSTASPEITPSSCWNTPHKISRIRIFRQTVSVKLACFALRVYSLQFPPLAQSITPYIYIYILSIRSNKAHMFLLDCFCKVAIFSN